MYKIASDVPSHPLTVKYGGNAMSAQADTEILDDIAALRDAGHSIVLVHGGGPEIDEALHARGLSTRRVDGLRVTDAPALGVVEAVLCATANKRIVRACLQRGIPAVGLSGQDGGTIRVRRARSPRGADLGFVGEVVSVDTAAVVALLRAGFVPVVAPICIDERLEHAYNVNADTVAGALAAALQSSAYVSLTSVTRVLRNPQDTSSAIDRMTVNEALIFAQSAACTDGMKPKILAAAHAVRDGARRAYIRGAGRHPITGAMAGDATVIARSR